MKNKKPLEELTKEELLEKCKNQRGVIKDYKKQIDFLKHFIEATNNNKKVTLCYEETMSLFDDIEQLKNKEEV